MAAGGWFDWSTGDLVTEARFQDIQDSLVFIFASESAANSALTNKVEGTIFYDTGADLLKAWNGSAWITAESGDIEGITTSSTSGLDGGATSGTPSLSVKPNSATSGTVAAGDEILFGDINDSNNLKKTTAQDIANLAPAGGITMLDVFILTSDITGSNGDITANLSRASYSGFSQLGTGMTESSGIFTFPATGFYEVTVQPNFEINNDPSAEVIIVFSNDNFSSETNVAAASMGNRSNTGAHFYQFERSVILDITNVSTHKVKFKTASFASNTALFDDNTRFVFKKLADT